MSIRKGAHTVWVQLLNDQDNLFPVPAAGGALDLIATGKGLVFYHAYLAEPGAPGPEQGIKHAKPLVWDATPPAPAAPAAPASAVAIWKPLFIQLPRETPIRPLPLDGSALIPAGWPGGCEDFYRSARSAGKKRHTMVLDLSANASAKGGVALLIHPARVDRKQLLITVGDGVDKHVVLPPLQFADNQWTAFVIPASAAPDLAQLATITLEDDNGLDFVAEDGGFLLARAAVCSNRAPDAEMLGVRPPSLVRDDQRVKTLPRLLEALGRFRRRSWAKATDPAKLRVLAPAPFGQDWRIEVRQRLEALPLGKLPGAVFAELSFQDSWLDGMFKSAGQNQPAILDPQVHHVAVVCTGGAELAGGASAAQALDGFWKKRLEQLINNGILPVVVLGPDRVPEERRAEAAKLWTDLAEFIAKRLPGVPVIDLRATASAKRPDVVFEDWSKESYAGWTVEGSAFGAGPLKRGQTPGAAGGAGDDERVVNSFAPSGSDAATGKLTSRSFVIERDWIRFLIGGGDSPTQLGLRVLVGGAVVASATGRNDNRMSQQILDVRAQVGKEAVIEIVDAATGGFGQIGVGRIVFTDARPEDQSTANRWTADLIADGYAEFTYWLRRVGGAK